MEPEVIERTFRLKKRVPSTYFNIAWSLWQAGKPVNTDNLTNVLKALGEDIDRDAAAAMVEIADFLIAACPAV